MIGSQKKTEHRPNMDWFCWVFFNRKPSPSMFFSPSCWPLLTWSDRGDRRCAHPGIKTWSFEIVVSGAITILKNMSQWEGLSHIWWKIKNAWNHQPATNGNVQSMFKDFWCDKRLNYWYNQPFNAFVLGQHAVNVLHCGKALKTIPETLILSPKIK